MLTVVRLVSVVTLCAGLGSLSLAYSNVPGETSDRLENSELASISPVSNLAQQHFPVTALLFHGAAYEVPPWLETLLQRVSKWLDRIIDAVAEHAPEPTVSGEPTVVVVNPAPAPASLTVEQVEASLVVQTNAARAAAGLPPLQVDAALTALVS